MLQLRPRLLATLLPLFTAVPGLAEVTPYGSGVNPPDSLLLVSGSPEVGGSFTLGIQNPALPTAPPALAFVALSLAPDPAFPAGTLLAGLGLGGAGSSGELLISVTGGQPFATLGPVAWGGGANPPAEFGVEVPLNAALIGATVYAQGALVTTATSTSIGVTNGLVVEFEPTVIDNFVFIPAGTFSMGTDASAGAPYFAEQHMKPPHQVTISKPFWMSRYEVTQQQFLAVMGFNPSLHLGANRPVDQIYKGLAIQFCEALNASAATAGDIPPGYEYRLPTEAEWEYACRAGTTDEFHYGPELFCDDARIGFSNHSQSSCNVAIPPSQPNSGSLPVGSFEPNAWGLYDMHGNVTEWVLDTLSDYPAEPQVDPVILGPSSFNIVRGGGFADDSFRCTSAARLVTSVGAGPPDRGFRVVLAPQL